MMTPTGDAGSARYESLGYVEFCTRLEDDPVFAKWFRRLRSDIDQVAARKRSERSRLIVLQNKLIDLIEFETRTACGCPQTARTGSRCRVSRDRPKDSVVNVTALVPLDKTDREAPAGHLPTSLLNEIDRGLRHLLGL